MLICLLLATCAATADTPASEGPDLLEREELEHLVREFWKDCRGMLPDREGLLPERECQGNLSEWVYPIPGSSATDYDYVRAVRDGLRPAPSGRWYGAGGTRPAPGGLPPLHWELDDTGLEALYRRADWLLGKTLKDPYTVRAYAVSQPFGCRDTVDNAELVCACARYNARAPAGGYVGAKILVVAMKRDGSFQQEPRSRWCALASLFPRSTDGIGEAADSVDAAPK